MRFPPSPDYEPALDRLRTQLNRFSPRKVIFWGVATLSTIFSILGTNDLIRYGISPFDDDTYQWGPYGPAYVGGKSILTWIGASVCAVYCWVTITRTICCNVRNRMTRDRYTAQPATKPADKAPVKDQPSTPTPKDAPR